jgi:phage anti-repressor protein
MALININDTNEELSQLLRDSFTSDEQQLFIQSFQTYLKYGKNNKAFVINLDDVWAWIGFSKIGNAKHLLVSKFTEDEDYKISKTGNENSVRGGHNKETITMTVTTFKHLCITAATTRARQICNYYVKMEEILQDYIILQNAKLAQSHAKLEHSLMFERHNALIQGNHKKNLVYVVKLESFPDGSYIIKIGKSNDIKDRVQSISAELGAPAIVMDVFPCEKNYDFEQFLHNHPRLTSIKYTDMVNGRMTSTETYHIKTNAAYGCIKRLIEREIYKYRHESIHHAILSTLNEIMYMSNHDTCTFYATLDRIKAFVPSVLVNADESVDLLMSKFYDTARDEFGNGVSSECDTTTPLSTPSTTPVATPTTTPVSTPSTTPVATPTTTPVATPTTTPVATTNTTNLFQPKTTALTGPRVQQYDAADHTKLLRVFDGITEVTRELPNTSYTALKFAARNKLMYVGYRWHLLDRADPTYNQPKPIGATRDSKTKKMGVVAMVNLERTEILRLFPTQKDAAQHVSQEPSALCVAIKFTRQLSGYYWYMYEDLDQTMKDAYLKNNNVPDVIKTSRGVKVLQINPETNAVEKEYKSIMDVCKECAMSPKKVKEIATCEGIYKGFKWKFAR